MSLLELANELLIQIVESLDTERDINCIAVCNKRLYALFNVYLYTYHIKLHSAPALIWAAQQGRESTLRRFLDLGADINIKTNPAWNFAGLYGSSWNIFAMTPLNSLYVSCLSGQSKVARILLEAGINDSEYARQRESLPLYYALQQGHDDVALVLLEYFNDANSTLSWCRSTPLHLASNLGLPKLVRYLLEKGTDVNAEDSAGVTPLQYAMLGDPSGCEACSRTPFFGLRQTVEFQSKGEGFDADIETVKLLLEYGAEPRQKMGHESWRHRHTAIQLARNHPDRKMRKLFDVDNRWLMHLIKWN